LYVSLAPGELVRVFCWKGDYVACRQLYNFPGAAERAIINSLRVIDSVGATSMRYDMPSQSPKWKRNHWLCLVQTLICYIVAT
jgi:hypothetical protein